MRRKKKGLKLHFSKEKIYLPFFALNVFKLSVLQDTEYHLFAKIPAMQQKQNIVVNSVLQRYISVNLPPLDFKAFQLK